MDAKIDDVIRLRAEKQLQKFCTHHDLIHPDGKTVHQLRVLTKKLRAYLSLYPEAVRPQAKKVQARLKQIADFYAGSRDSAVLLKTLRQQIKSFKSAKRERLESWLLSLSVNKTTDVGLPDGQETADLLRLCLDEWPTDPVDWNPQDGIQVVFAKAQKIGKRALKQNDDTLLHRWRKWTKHLYYSVALLDIAPETKASRKQLKTLGDKLGQYHDLVMLESVLSTELPADGDLKVLVSQTLALIGESKAGYKKQFSRQYTKLYSDRHLFHALD